MKRSINDTLRLAHNTLAAMHESTIVFGNVDLKELLQDLTTELQYTHAANLKLERIVHECVKMKEQLDKEEY